MKRIQHQPSLRAGKQLHWGAGAALGRAGIAVPPKLEGSPVWKLQWLHHVPAADIWRVLRHENRTVQLLQVCMCSGAVTRVSPSPRAGWRLTQVGDPAEVTQPPCSVSQLSGKLMLSSLRASGGNTEPGQNCHFLLFHRSSAEQTQTPILPLCQSPVLGPGRVSGS